MIVASIHFNSCIVNLCSDPNRLIDTPNDYIVIIWNNTKSLTLLFNCVKMLQKLIFFSVGLHITYKLQDFKKMFTKSIYFLMNKQHSTFFFTT